MIDVQEVLKRARTVLKRVVAGEAPPAATPSEAVEMPDVLADSIYLGDAKCLVRKDALATGEGHDRFWLSGTTTGPIAIVKLAPGIPVDLEEFDRRLPEHHVSVDVRKRLWPRTRRLVLHPVLEVEKVDHAAVEVVDDLPEDDGGTPARPDVIIPPLHPAASEVVPEVVPEVPAVTDDADLEKSNKSFAGFANFAECVRTQVQGGYTPESARKVCGALMRDTEKADVVEFEKAKWSTAFVNTLPDSSFLYISPGGKKDAEGKTAPRDLRHFPYKDASGKIDLPHLRNAVQRIPQSDAPGLSADKKAALQAKGRKLLAAAQGKMEKGATYEMASGDAAIVLAVEGEDLPADVVAELQVEVAKKVWSTAFVNDLSDSAFLHVEGGGKKDDEGKTKPRSLRHFPYKDADGKVDLPHLRNALSRIPQASFLSQAQKDALQAKARKLLTGAVVKKHDVRILKAEATDVEEERYVLGVVLEPDVVDSQNDTYSAEEIRKTAHRWMEESGALGLMHKKIIGGFKEGSAHVLESYLAPVGFEKNGQVIKEGSWLLGLRVVGDEEWGKVKKGDLTSFSIGGDSASVTVSAEEAATIPDATPNG